MKRRAFLKSLVATLTISASPRLLADDSIHATTGEIQRPLTAVQIPKGQFVTLCMHDVIDENDAALAKDPYAIGTQQLTALFDWMQENNWHPISLQQVLDAEAGKAALPDNAVLLSWDDGLSSIYTKVFPLLKAYNYPGLFAIETDWITRVQQGEAVVYQAEGAAGPKNPTKAFKADEDQSRKSSNLIEPGKVFYNGTEMGAAGFANWAQLREMQASGLVEFASHTNDQHHGILANPQGNVEPATITRLYLPELKRYETDQEFHRRIFDDLNTSAAILQKWIGVRPRTIVWPYGAMNQEVEAIATEAGLFVSFGLGDRHLNRKHQSPSTFGRLLVMNDPSPVSIEEQVSESITHRPETERAVQVDLDYIYDPDPKRSNENLGKLLDRIKALKIRTVYLQAFADPEGTGTPKELYFPNSVLPMRTDLFNRVAWQLQTRAGVRVLAWLPMLAYQLPDAAQQARLSVKVKSPDGSLVPAKRDYHRLSPFLPESLEIIGRIYADLGKSNTGINGLLIHDDAYLAEDEDATVLEPQARWPGTDTPMNGTMLTPRQKTDALIAFGNAATEKMRFYVNSSNYFSTARNMYARVVLDPKAEVRFAQALPPFLTNYDHVALMAMPYLDGTDEPPAQWLKKLATAVAEQPGGLQKVVFELQTKNWQNDEWINGETLKSWMQLLIRMGGTNLAYYPDDFLNNQPPFKPTYEGISLNDFPYYPVKP